MGDIHHLAGGQVLGQRQEVMVTSMVIAPTVFIELVDNAGGLALRGRCLRIVDPLSGQALFSPITPPAARAIAATLLNYAEQETRQGGSDGVTAVHE